MESFGKRMQAGAIWMLVAKLFDQGLGLVSTLVLARLLVPEDFGLVAMATAVIAALELLTAFSFDMALIQNQKATRAHYNTVWTFNLLLGLTVGLALLLLAVPVAQFYREPKLELVMVFLAAGVLIQGLENVGIVDFRKEMQFHKEFQFVLLKKIASVSTGIVLALTFRSYWALVGGILAGKAVGLVLSYAMHPYRPRLSLEARGELFHFSKWLLLNNLLSFLWTRSADIVIGRFLGSRPLGLYNMALTIAHIPTTNLSAPINRAVFPGYAKMSDDLAVLRQGFLNVISVISLVTLPAAGGIAVTAELAVGVLLGEKWAGAVPLLQILAFYTAISAINGNIFYVFTALGTPRTFTFLVGGSLLVFLPILIILTREYGPWGAAVAQLATNLIFFPIYYGTLLRRLDLRLGRFLAVMWRPVLGTGIMFAVVDWFQSQISLSQGTAGAGLELLLAILLGALVYVVVVLILWQAAGRPEGAERFLLDRSLGIVRKIGARA